MNLPSDQPSFTHELVAAWRFFDVFSNRLISDDLLVRVENLVPSYPKMPTLPWLAVQGDDSTYRFLVSNSTSPPTGIVSVLVDAPSLRYRAYEPLQMTLPISLSSPPHPQRSDYLLSLPLFPTRLFRVPPGETAVSGTIKSTGALLSVAKLKVTLWSFGPPTPPPGTPHTYTDENGDFVFRLLGPDYLIETAGGVVTTTAALSIDIRTPPTYSTSITPTTAFPQTINLGRVNTLPIQVP